MSFPVGEEWFSLYTTDACSSMKNEIETQQLCEDLLSPARCVVAERERAKK